MKKQDKIFSAVILLIIMFMLVSTAGCSCDSSKFDVSGHTGDDKNTIKSVEDITNLVTDDEKLVINYYDAYIWIVYFDNLGTIRSMTYIYEFSDSQEAESMVSTRTEELEKNKTMTIVNARAVEQYLVVDLTDTSFTNVTRSILETNFSGLIVY